MDSHSKKTHAPGDQAHAPGGPALGARIPRGFTLVEIIIVVFLLGTLAVVAISSYVNSTDTFTFLSEYKNVMSLFRNARSSAINNSEIGGDVPARYGVQIDSVGAAFFADTGDASFAFDPAPSPPVGGINYDTIIRRLNFTGYAQQVLDSSPAHNPLLLPVEIFYESGSGDLTIINGDDDIVAGAEEKYVAIRFFETPEPGLSKFIMIFQVSGLPETFDELPRL